MILDTSAMVAIVMKEAGHEELLRVMGGGDAAIGTATLAETAIVLSARLKSDARPLLARLADEPLLFVGEDFARTDVARC